MQTTQWEGGCTPRESDIADLAVLVIFMFLWGICLSSDACFYTM